MNRVSQFDTPSDYLNAIKRWKAIHERIVDGTGIPLVTTLTLAAIATLIIDMMYDCAPYNIHANIFYIIVSIGILVVCWMMVRNDNVLCTSLIDDSQRILTRLEATQKNSNATEKEIESVTNDMIKVMKKFYWMVRKQLIVTHMLIGGATICALAKLVSNVVIFTKYLSAL